MIQKFLNKRWLFNVKQNENRKRHSRRTLHWHQLVQKSVYFHCFFIYVFKFIDCTQEMYSDSDRLFYRLAVYPLRKGPINEINIVHLYHYLCTYIQMFLYIHNWCFVEKIHLILTRNSQDMDLWNIYLQFWGHVRLWDSANKCAYA